MEMLSSILKVAIVVVSIVLIILVLIQPDQSHGMSGSMGLGASNTVFGVSKDGGPLAKATKVVAFLFILLAFLLYLVSKVS